MRTVLALFPELTDVNGDAQNAARLRTIVRTTALEWIRLASSRNARS